MFYGFQSYEFSCKHEIHNLLTLASYYNVMYEAKDVIKTAIKDLYHTKKGCIYTWTACEATGFGGEVIAPQAGYEYLDEQQKHK